MHVITANQAAARGITAQELEVIATWHDHRIQFDRENAEHHKAMAKRLRTTAKMVRSIRRQKHAHS